MKLSLMKLPSAIKVDGIFYEIRTGHPDWFRFSELLKDKSISLLNFDFLYIKNKPQDRVKGFHELMGFYAPEKLLPRALPEDKTNIIALDYELDADLIYSAILEQYGIDLFDKEIHWHKVKAMISNLHGTKLNDVISYRLYEPPKKNDTQENIMKKLQRQWAIPTPEDEQARKAKEHFTELLNRQKKNDSV